MSGGAPAGSRAALPGYEPVRAIGTGASGVVWEAVQHSTGRSVALKLLDVDVSDADTRRRFDRERRAMATMAAHPNVVTVLDAGIDDGRAWLAMELCARGSLATRLAREGPLDVRTALETLVDVAGALGAAHDRGILHCDVKPANVLLTDYGVPAVGDFGIARVAVSPTTTASVALTLDYAAPELLDDGRHTVASDVYALGVTTWELLAGYSPFRGPDGASPATIVHRIVTRPLPDPPPHVPPPGRRAPARDGREEPGGPPGLDGDGGGPGRGAAPGGRTPGHRPGAPREAHFQRGLPPAELLACRAAPAIAVGHDGRRRAAHRRGRHRRRPVAGGVALATRGRGSDPDDNRDDPTAGADAAGDAPRVPT